jgi:outer membrane immunogenic protein
MKFTHLASICAAFGALVSTAHAADMPARVAKAPAAVAAPVFSWTGPYSGLHCGAAWGRVETTGLSGAFDNGFTTVVPLRDSGWLCGAQAGFNWQAGSWLYGIESDIGYLSLADSVFNFVGTGDDAAAFKFKSWYGTLTGRVGPTWDRSALYLKGGAAVARIRHIAGDDNLTDIGDLTSVSKTKWGWALGVGYEQALQSNWTWKIEYLYMDFGKITSGNADGDTFEHRNRVHTVKLGLNYLFATGKYPVAPVVTKY